MSYSRHFKRVSGVGAFSLVEVMIALGIAAVVFVAWLKVMNDIQTARLQNQQIVAVRDYLNEHVHLFQSGVIYQERLPGDGTTNSLRKTNVILPGGTNADTVDEVVTNQGNHLLLTETVSFYLVGVGQETLSLTGVRY